MRKFAIWGKVLTHVGCPIGDNDKPSVASVGRRALVTFVRRTLITIPWFRRHFWIKFHVFLSLSVCVTCSSLFLLFVGLCFHAIGRWMCEQISYVLCNDAYLMQLDMFCDSQPHSGIDSDWMWKNFIKLWAHPNVVSWSRQRLLSLVVNLTGLAAKSFCHITFEHVLLSQKSLSFDRFYRLA